MNEWKKLWQQERANSLSSEELIKKLNLIEKKSRFGRRAMFVSFGSGILLLLFLLPVLENIYYSVSLLCFLAGMSLLLVQSYKNKFDFLDEETLNNKEFTQKLLQKLDGKLRMLSKTMAIYTLLLLLGINIAYLKSLEELSLFPRIFLHSGVSVAILLFMLFTLKRKRKKLREEITPLRERLREFQNQGAS